MLDMSIDELLWFAREAGERRAAEGKQMQEAAAKARASR